MKVLTMKGYMQLLQSSFERILMSEKNGVWHLAAWIGKNEVYDEEITSIELERWGMKFRKAPVPETMKATMINIWAVKYMFNRLREKRLLPVWQGLPDGVETIDVPYPKHKR